MAEPAVLSFGCRLNLFESEVITALLIQQGASNTVAVNTCAVTEEAERQARQAIRRLRRERPGVHLVATGCAAQLNPASWAALPGVDRVLGNADKLRAQSWAPGAPPAVSDLATRDPAPAIARFTGHTRAFLPVQGGCDHRCTFCTIPFARGPNRSVPAGAVVSQLRALVAGGTQEAVLTGVDIASYGADLPGRPTLGQLVRRVLALVPGLPRLRVSSLDPAAIDPALWDVLANEPRFMPHLHLSVQAGADLVLKRMKRRHSRSQALAVIAHARALRPGLAIGADLIAGFPTETDALFAETLDFVREAAIPYLHVFPYSERPGTPAARMPAVPPPVRRDRAAQLRAAASGSAGRFHAAQLGQLVSVLAERGGRGHTEHFCPVRSDAPPGTVRRARVVAADAAGLVAEAA